MRRAGGVASRLGGMATQAGTAARRIGSQARRMGGAARRVRGWRLLAPWAASALAVLALGILLFTPTAHNAVRLATRLATAATTLSRHAPRAPATAPSGTLFEETPAVGALFVVSAGGLGRHFCTASVVHSPHGDLVITAAHCVSSRTPGQIAFVPGYHDGADPYGVWFVTGSSWTRGGGTRGIPATTSRSSSSSGTAARQMWSG